MLPEVQTRTVVNEGNLPLEVYNVECRNGNSLPVEQKSSTVDPIDNAARIERERWRAERFRELYWSCYR